jgi:carbonic anhydrase
VEGKKLNAKDLLPGSKSYYTYTGSLTTPPCTESVRWFVLATPVVVTDSSIQQLHALIGTFPGYDGYQNNNRPVAPLNGRAVMLVR